MLKKLIWIIVCLALVGGIGTAVYAYNVYTSAKETANEIYEPVDPKTNNKKSIDKSENPKPLTFLLMGVDKRPGDKGRTDTMVVLRLNPKTKTMKLISIPRDTRVNIPGRGYDKVNAAYAYGGTELAMDTVEQYLDISLDYYIKVNMQGLKDIVNAVDGITVYNNSSWRDEGYYKEGYLYREGYIHLNGAQTLGYVRMRHLDPRGDIGRNERQREVIRAIIDEASGLGTFKNYKNILNAVSDNVKTNMTFDNMKYIAANYKDCQKQVVTYQMKGEPTHINGIFYLDVPQSEREKIHQMVSDKEEESETS